METTNNNSKIDQIVNTIIGFFREFNGTKYVGIREYTNDYNETANFVINANFNYGNAVQTSIDILNSLTNVDFQSIANIYKVNNEGGTQYATNEGGRRFLNEGKLPKEGTKARIDALNGVKVTKTLETIRNEMVANLDANKNDETRSEASQAQLDAYKKVCAGIKVCIKTERVHIYALVHTKDILIEGVYGETKHTLEKSQKLAIERYCKEVLKKQLPVTKYRNFVIEVEKMTSVALKGSEVVIE